jgi:hypothetical protein
MMPSTQQHSNRRRRRSSSSSSSSSSSNLEWNSCPGQAASGVALHSTLL